MFKWILPAVIALLLWYFWPQSEPKTKLVTTWQAPSLEVVTPTPTVEAKSLVVAPVATKVAQLAQISAAPSKPVSASIEADASEQDQLLQSILTAMQRHAQIGIEEDKLKQLEQVLMEQGGAFVVADNLTRYTIAQSFFKANDKSGEQRYRDIRQSRDEFLAKINNCKSCNDQLAKDLLELLEVNFAYSPHDHLIELQGLKPRLAKEYPMFFAWYYALYLPVYQPDNPLLEQSARKLLESENREFIALGNKVLALLSGDIKTWLNQWLLAPDDPALIESWSIKFIAQAGYEAYWQWQQQNLLRLYEVNPEFTLDSILFHGQYFSVQDAWQQVDRLSSEHKSLMTDPHYLTLLQHKQQSVEKIALVWPERVAAHDAKQAQTWPDKRGNSTDLDEWHKRLATLMSSDLTAEQFIPSWLGQFANESDGLSILEEHTDWPVLLRHRLILLAAHSYVPQIITSWNANVKVLNDARINHKLQALSLKHWRIYAIWAAEPEATKLDALVLYLFDYLIDEEKEQVRKLYQGKLKNDHQLSDFSWLKMQTP